MSKIPVIAVVGPTASGKTELAVNLAKKLNGEIISFDSMQIYKGMHIASAAPDFEEMQGVKHHLLEFLEPSHSFSVADFLKEANDVVQDIINRNKRVIIAGGTGLYIDSFLENINFSQNQTDEDLRNQLNAEYDNIGGEKMLEKLREFDPDSAQRLHPNNKKRVIRAFEIYMTTGITMSQQLENSHQNPSPYTPYILGLSFKDREKLYNRIDSRVDNMIEHGLLGEAKAMYDRGYSSTAVQAIGHKEFFPYFKGEISLEESTELLKRETRRYAKRQLTWFRRNDKVNWIYRDITEDILEEALKILERNGYFGETT